MRDCQRNFLDDESGAVTVDWVVLTAAVVGLAGITYHAINGPTGNVATSVSNSISGTSVSTNLNSN
ncbi:hypothetical protein FGK63_09610 [Ruegeria sediminis]|uniref:Pilus assembly protein n=1 Tax=Ruegeria sediminis TaxID=2583820 RepID=A0ABY2WXY6_9RHOB|nr:hypothetical protein [Ruegeria sediminis]TMV07714.1 hypothetical protein FGK63_09610 [Ruegeria sediminis]